MIGALVKKDFVFLITSLKSTLVTMVLFPLLFPIGSLGMGIVTPSLVCYIGVYGILAYEEKSKMQLLNMALPVTRREICISKYVYAIGIVLATSLLSCIGTVIGAGLHSRIEMQAFMKQLPFYALLMVAGGSLYIAIILPCVFYWGTIKARYILMGVYIMGFVLATNIKFSMFEAIGSYLNSIFMMNSTVVIIGITLLGIAISLQVSLKIWEKKDVR